MSASVRKVAGLVAAVVLSAVVVVGCGDDDSGGGISPNTSSCTSPGKTVTIGGVTWMAENLNCATSNSWCYGNDNSNCTKYGRLYTWDAAMTSCPSGWRLPDTADWNRLFTAAGGSSIAGSKLKSTSGWFNNGNGTDEFGFSALPGGRRNANGTFSSAGDDGLWWSATENDSGDALSRNMNYDITFVVEFIVAKGFGLSVRCVR
ncbi:MAG: fibrobacter succinogenes major paralogous domain-containing protein [Chitinispirillia bacterium]|nr:fibrobacter succinogenes major paralogous domain-containing protein [Chitinispirillia bacterium]MCL2268725.1 fibrobacter succinogenes major paralogous domain-containing protein [Chitinispirillia bacterium]